MRRAMSTRALSVAAPSSRAWAMRDASSGETAARRLASTRWPSGSWAKARTAVTGSPGNSRPRSTAAGEGVVAAHAGGEQVDDVDVEVLAQRVGELAGERVGGVVGLERGDRDDGRGLAEVPPGDRLAVVAERGAQGLVHGRRRVVELGLQRGVELLARRDGVEVERGELHRAGLQRLHAREAHRHEAALQEAVGGHHGVGQVGLDGLHEAGLQLDLEARGRPAAPEPVAEALERRHLGLAARDLLGEADTARAPSPSPAGVTCRRPAMKVGSSQRTSSSPSPPRATSSRTNSSVAPKRTGTRSRANHASRSRWAATSMADPWVRAVRTRESSARPRVRTSFGDTPGMIADAAPRWRDPASPPSPGTRRRRGARAAGSRGSRPTPDRRSWSCSRTTARRLRRLKGFSMRALGALSKKARAFGVKVPPVTKIIRSCWSEARRPSSACSSMPVIWGIITSHRMTS